MRTQRWQSLAGCGLLLALVVALATQAQAPRPTSPKTFKERVIADSKVAEEDVEKVLRAIGPAVRDMLASGDVVDLPGLGRFRVVRIPQHRDMVNGRPATIPASNYAEFLPAGDILSAANAPNSQPAETVPAFEYKPLPGQTPGAKMPSQRAPATRTR